MSETVSTGIPALDTFLKGGLPKGFTTVLLAPVGSGAEILAKQFCQGAQGRVIYLTTDESQDEVQTACTAAACDFGNVTVLDLQTEFAEP